MPVEYGHGHKEYVSSDSSTVTQYTKWFVLNNYEYVIHFSNNKFTIHAHSLTTGVTTKCESGDSLEQAYQHAYSKLRAINTQEG